MKLKKLIKDLSIQQIKGNKDVEITGICSNSKLVGPGNLFIAKKGFSEDGAQYIPEAIEAGAIAILTDIFDPSFKNVVQLIHPNVASLEGILAANYYRFPSEELWMVGITGTNGKTTTSFIVKHLLEKSFGPCGLIGTIEYIIGQHRYQATRTTPDVISNHKMLREMILNDCKSAVMEVTSHALDQGRVEHINFDAAVFTNLTQDHLDYHKTLENYCQTKNKLFRSLDLKNRKHLYPYPKTAIVNADCPWSTKILHECNAPMITYGIINYADLKGFGIELNPDGTTFQVAYEGKNYTCYCPLAGRYNVYNCLAGLAVGLSRNIPIEVLIAHLATVPPVPGRLQPVSNPLGLNIYVDFAHSEDALTNVLECLHEIKDGRIITVFGCGGDRDRSKRPKMAQASEKLSSLSIVTSDNPRSEDPQQIIDEITKGFSLNSYIIEPDRKTAISKAIHCAHPKDIILIAGKGHETYQIFAHKTTRFDDAEIAYQICNEIYETKELAGKV